MRVAFLVLAHSNPKHLHRLLSALDHDDVGVFVHVDRKSDSLLDTLRGFPRVTAIRERYSIFWGQFAMVRATLGLMRVAIEATPTYDYFVLASGVDYPLKGIAYIRDYLERMQGAEFMDCERISRKKHFEHRFEIMNFNVPGFLRGLPAKAVRKVLAKAGGYLVRYGYRRDYRRVFEGMEPCQGGQWWCLSRDACRYVLDFVDAHPAFVRFCQNIYIPDESFFQTILGNSPFASAILPAITFADWSRPEGPCPALIDEAHLADFRRPGGREHVDAEGRRSEYLMARKFSDAHEAICQALQGDW